MDGRKIIVIYLDTQDTKVKKVGKQKKTVYKSLTLERTRMLSESRLRQALTKHIVLLFSWYWIHRNGRSLHRIKTDLFL